MGKTSVGNHHTRRPGYLFVQLVFFDFYNFINPLVDIGKIVFLFIPAIAGRITKGTIVLTENNRAQ